jgi:hypothetical protein
MELIPQKKKKTDGTDAPLLLATAPTRLALWPLHLQLESSPSRARRAASRGAAACTASRLPRFDFSIAPISVERANRNTSGPLSQQNSHPIKKSTDGRSIVDLPTTSNSNTSTGVCLTDIPPTHHYSSVDDKLVEMYIHIRSYMSRRSSIPATALVWWFFVAPR